MRPGGRQKTKQVVGVAPVGVVHHHQRVPRGTLQRCKHCFVDAPLDASRNKPGHPIAFGEDHTEFHTKPGLPGTTRTMNDSNLHCVIGVPVGCPVDQPFQMRRCLVWDSPTRGAHQLSQALRTIKLNLDRVQHRRQSLHGGRWLSDRTPVVLVSNAQMSWRNLSSVSVVSSMFLALRRISL